MKNVIPDLEKFNTSDVDAISSFSLFLPPPAPSPRALVVVRRLLRLASAAAFVARDAPVGKRVYAGGGTS